MVTESQGVLGTLGLNVTGFIGQLFNFGVVLFILWRFVYRPLMRLMDERSAEISTGLANAKEASAALERATSERETVLRDARSEAQALLKETAEKAEELRKTHLQETKQEIEKLAVEAKAQIATEREAAFSTVRRDVADLVAEGIKAVFNNIDKKTADAFLEQAVKDIEKKA